MPRDPAVVTADAAKMRADMAAHKPANGPYDIKLGDGSLVDLEFDVQVSQLPHRTGPHPQPDRAVAELTAPGLNPPGNADAPLPHPRIPLNHPPTTPATR